MEFSIRLEFLNISDKKSTFEPEESKLIIKTYKYIF